MEIASDIKKDKSVSTTGGWVFKLCYIIGILLALLTIFVAYMDKGWKAGLIMVGATVLFLILGPISWSIGDRIRKFIMPDRYLTFGAKDAFNKKIFWLVGPQWSSFLVAFGVVIGVPMLFITDEGFKAATVAPVQQPTQSAPAVVEVAPPVAVPVAPAIAATPVPTAVAEPATATPTAQVQAPPSATQNTVNTQASTEALKSLSEDKPATNQFAPPPPPTK